MKTPTKILLGMALGLVWALLSTQLGGSEFTQTWIAPWGTIFINLLKLIAVPLVLFSIIDGVASLGDPKALGRMGGKTLGLYLFTTVLAISSGLLLVNALRPGDAVGSEQQLKNRLVYEAWADNVHQGKTADGVRYSSRPENKNAWLEAQQIQSSTTANATAQELPAKPSGPLSFITDAIPSNIFVAFNDGLMLQIIFFALFFGTALVALPESKTASVRPFMTNMTDIFVKMVEQVMGWAPFFVFALMASTLTKIAGDDPLQLLQVFKTLGLYGLVVLMGLFVVAVFVYPTLVWLSLRKQGYSWWRTLKFFHGGMRPAQLLAFSTSSSAATLPVTLDCVKNNLGVREEVSQFTLPIGATVNMDGTSLYQGVAVIFLAQFHLIDLSMAQQLTVLATAVLASIGTAAIPSAGLVMLLMVLDSVALNPAWIAVIIPIDRLLDMCRTVINVTGDAAVTLFVAKTENQWHEPQ
jgi:Na+/H+-dicarboxylate symporter